MTRLINAGADFAAESLEGYAASHPDWVLPVPGGVVRSEQGVDGRVAVIMGGGAGHFPAFAGWVGPGFGHGAACGNIFASPAESQILTVARASSLGGGLLFAPINYAGDILHFTAAAEQLRSEGFDVRLVPITDDIASAPAETSDTRRGIAGSFLVLKIVGASADRGDSLDEVERIARAANAATRSFGVAFGGCTLPGSAEPLFTVPAGRMAIGLGIHGEPGISEAPLGTADDIADLLVDGLLGERAAEPGRAVAILVNGLGSTKYDELFVVFRRVSRRIEDAGMRLVEPVVGEQVTSLDMAGVSLSITYLDDELETLWTADASVASFSRGRPEGRPRRTLDTIAEAAAVIPHASPASRLSAEHAVGVFDAIVELLRTEESHLGAIDAVAGDGDHGVGMLRGAVAAAAATRDVVSRGAGLGTALSFAGKAWSDGGGGTSGALWGAGLDAAGGVLGDERAPSDSSAISAVRAFCSAIVERGKAELGDKTMVDAVLPFVEALERADDNVPLAQAWQDAATAAAVAAEATADIVSRRGRSRIHGDHSIGTPDPGAVSFALIAATIGEELGPPVAG